MYLNFCRLSLFLFGYSYIMNGELVSMLVCVYDRKSKIAIEKRESERDRQRTIHLFCFDGTDSIIISSNRMSEN